MRQERAHLPIDVYMLGSGFEPHMDYTLAYGVPTSRRFPRNCEVRGELTDFMELYSDDRGVLDLTEGQSAYNSDFTFHS